MSVGKNESKCQNAFFSINDLHSNLDLILPTDMMRNKKNFKLDSSWYDGLQFGAFSLLTWFWGVRTNGREIVENRGEIEKEIAGTESWREENKHCGIKWFLFLWKFIASREYSGEVWLGPVCSWYGSGQVKLA